jgi:hypothetical protein
MELKFHNTNNFQKKWQNMSIYEQLGNIGSEYERALKWKQQRDNRFQNAVDRMLELFELTLDDKRWHNHRLNELTRAREVACAELYGDKELGGNPEGLKKYFFQFATLARANM